MTVDHSGYKLGKKPALHDPRTLQMANYLELPPVPPARDWTEKAAAHFIQAWSANAGPKEIVLPDQAILKTYEAVSGYKPSEPSTDRGAVELDVLRYWRKTGIGGYKIDAFVALEPCPGGRRSVRRLLHRPRAAGVGAAAEGLVGAAGRPDGDRRAGLVGRPRRGRRGQKKKMTWSFWDTYCDESYACLSELWAGKKPAPSGFNLAALQADLKELVG
jgi:hypothetical protein